METYRWQPGLQSRSAMSLKDVWGGLGRELGIWKLHHWHLTLGQINISNRLYWV